MTPEEALQLKARIEAGIRAKATEGVASEYLTSPEARAVDHNLEAGRIVVDWWKGLRTIFEIEVKISITNIDTGPDLSDFGVGPPDDHGPSSDPPTWPN